MIAKEPVDGHSPISFRGLLVIPPLEDGVLPEGVHECTFEELELAFGQFQRSDRRVSLIARLKDYLEEASRSGLVVAVIIDGSFVTAKDEPEDIDLIVVLKSDVNWESLRPFEYNAVSKRMIKQMYRFDAFPYPEGSSDYKRLLNFFQDVRPKAAYTAKARKGVLRVSLRCLATRSSTGPTGQLEICIRPSQASTK